MKRRTTPLKRRTPLRNRSLTRNPITRIGTSKCSFKACTRRARVHVAARQDYCGPHGDAIADMLVGRAVKKRDGRCVSCGTPNTLEWAHILTRGMPYIRWNEDNAVALCHECHRTFTDEPRAWRLFIEDRFPGRIQSLRVIERRGQRSGESIDVAQLIRDHRQLGRKSA